MSNHDRPRMTRCEGGVYVGSQNGKTINAHRASDGNGHWFWIAKAEGAHGSMIVAKAQTMKRAVDRLIADYWF